MGSVMIMAMIVEKHPEGEIVGRDAQSAFNTVRREHMAMLLEGYRWLKDWVVGFLNSKSRSTAGQ